MYQDLRLFSSLIFPFLLIGPFHLMTFLILNHFRLFSSLILPFQLFKLSAYFIQLSFLHKLDLRPCSLDPIKHLFPFAVWPTLSFQYQLILYLGLLLPRFRFTFEFLCLLNLKFSYPARNHRPQRILHHLDQHLRNRLAYPLFTSFLKYLY